jgi:hypothetical protein
VVNIG